MKNFIVIMLSLALCGCGTLTSLSNSDKEIAHKLKRQKTHCESTSRAYGGVSYNFCTLHSKPSKTYIDWFLGFYLIDTAISAVTDTAALPYTFYQQTNRGNINIGS
jgi:uncharacterized protein YceK